MQRGDMSPPRRRRACPRNMRPSAGMSPPRRRGPGYAPRCCYAVSRAPRALDMRPDAGMCRREPRAAVGGPGHPLNRAQSASGGVSPTIQARVRAASQSWGCCRGGRRPGAGTGIRTGGDPDRTGSRGGAPGPCGHTGLRAAGSPLPHRARRFARRNARDRSLDGIRERGRMRATAAANGRRAAPVRAWHDPPRLLPNDPPACRIP